MATVIAPSRDDPFVASHAEGGGGALGRRSQPTWGRAAAFLVGILGAAVVFSAGIVMRAPCAASGFEDNTAFVKLCYSDIGKLYTTRGLDKGYFPYASRSDGTSYVEYPVLQGLLMWAPTLVVGTEGPLVDRTVAYYAISSVVLFALLLLALWATVSVSSRRPWDAVIVAIAPSVALVGTLNWDLLPVALLALAVLAWTREQPWWCGVLIGLGTAAKVYPGFLLLVLVVLAWRTRRWSGAWRAAAGAAGTWCLVNLPVAYLFPTGWGEFYRLSSQRTYDFGSLWIALRFLGVPIDRWPASLVASGTFVLVLIAIAWLVWRAPMAPRIGSLLFLVVAAFCLTNKVYSPQYALWLLPLIVLARPRWRDVLIWQAGEAIYYMGVWLWLHHFSDDRNSLADQPYALLILVHVAVTFYLVVLVVRDVRRPDIDPVRSGTDGSDPLRGELVDAR
jgi:uncharacterized membrane protein